MTPRAQKFFESESYKSFSVDPYINTSYEKKRFVKKIEFEGKVPKEIKHSCQLHVEGEKQDLHSSSKSGHLTRKILKLSKCE